MFIHNRILLPSIKQMNAKFFKNISRILTEKQLKLANFTEIFRLSFHTFTVWRWIFQLSIYVPVLVKLMVKYLQSKEHFSPKVSIWFNLMIKKNDHHWFATISLGCCCQILKGPNSCHNLYHASLEQSLCYYFVFWYYEVLHWSKGHAPEWNLYIR